MSGRSAGPDESSEYGSVIITLRRLRLGLLAMETGLHIDVWAAREGIIEVLGVGIHFNL